MEQRVVLVTGAASGIGAAVCRRVAGSGTRLVISARQNRDGLEVVAGGRLEGSLRERFVPVEKTPGRLWFPRGLGSHARAHVRWIVTGEGPVTVAYDAQKGGRVEASVARPR